MSNSNVPDSAKPVPISSLNVLLLDEKLRIAGMSLSYEPDHQILLVHDSMDHACLVDTSLVLDLMLAVSGLRETKTVITVIGYLERVQEGLPIPTVPAFVEAPIIDPTLVIRAILIAPSPDLNLLLWEYSIRQVEDADEEACVDELVHLDDS